MLVFQRIVCSQRNSAPNVKFHNEAVNNLFKDPEIVSKHAALGYDIADRSHVQFAAVIEGHCQYPVPIIRKAGLNAQ